MSGCDHSRWRTVTVTGYCPVRPVRYCYRYCDISWTDWTNSFDKTGGKFSRVRTDDRMRLWRSKVKVTPWFKYVVLQRHPRRRQGMEVHVVVITRTSLFFLRLVFVSFVFTVGCRGFGWAWPCVNAGLQENVECCTPIRTLAMQARSHTTATERNWTVVNYSSASVELS